MNRTLLIVPTRGRPDSCIELLDAFEENSSNCDIVFGIDDDDASVYPKRILKKADQNPRLRMGGTLNLLATKYAPNYDYLAFMGDDHRPRTKNWSDELIKGIEGRPGVAYGDDLFQGQNLPTAVLLSSEIVQKIGYMVPPVLLHMYMDNFWRDFGNAINNLYYNPDVVIEHMHYMAGKSVNDLRYQEVNAAHVYERDRIAYDAYKEKRFDLDVSKVLG